KTVKHNNNSKQQKILENKLLKLEKNKHFEMIKTKLLENGLKTAIDYSNRIEEYIVDIENSIEGMEELLKEKEYEKIKNDPLPKTIKKVENCFKNVKILSKKEKFQLKLSALELCSKELAFHRTAQRSSGKFSKARPILSDLGTYLYKAIPDTKLTIRKYADTKFEYLSYCLKVKEMDDEEYSYGALQEPLYRVETGNYEYRLILRCRQDARARFARLRSDVLVKMELLDNKHVQDVVWQLQRLVAGLADFHGETLTLLQGNSLFPIEVDLSRSAFQYKSTSPVVQDGTEDEDDDELLQADEAKEEFTSLIPELGE
ncbi:hypothetical protein L9F63_009501, partial [Diploptera punctata]